jgi:hypothetical protein
MAHQQNKRRRGDPHWPFRFKEIRTRTLAEDCYRYDDPNQKVVGGWKRTRQDRYKWWADGFAGEEYNTTDARKMIVKALDGLIWQR